LIQVFVESLDRTFENVCELDLIFHFDEVQYALNEIIQGGLVLETNIGEIGQCSELTVKEIGEERVQEGGTDLLFSPGSPAQPQGIGSERQPPSSIYARVAWLTAGKRERRRRCHGRCAALALVDWRVRGAVDEDPQHSVLGTRSSTPCTRHHIYMTSNCCIDNADQMIISTLHGTQIVVAPDGRHSTPCSLRRSLARW
jgi:hypothetical protein